MSRDRIKLYVLGTSGGPFDSLTQCFLLEAPNKTKNSTEDIHSHSYFMIDGGAGLSQISALFINQPLHRQVDFVSQLYSSKNEICLKSNVAAELTSSYFNIDLENKHPIIAGENNAIKTANLYSLIENVFITHAHLDHINGLILNLPIVFTKGFFGIKKTLYGDKNCISAIRNNIFNCKIWPDLVLSGASSIQSQSKIILQSMDHLSSVSINTKISVIRMKLSHGKTVQKPIRMVESSCYFVLNLINRSFIVVFGDCEWEELYFPEVWKKCIELMKEGFQLSTLVIECSSPDGENETNLYGHMNPRFLVAALKILYTMIPDTHIKDKYLNVGICHVKQEISLHDPRKVILKQINIRLKQENLEFYFKISVLLNGCSYTV
ncbi:hypothetical protein QEN19_001164 [Hanseniaspora menglaensis]